MAHFALEWSLAGVDSHVPLQISEQMGSDLIASIAFIATTVALGFMFILFDSLSEVLIANGTLELQWTSLGVSFDVTF